MTEQEIINSWKVGRTTLQVAKLYREEYNEKAKQKQYSKITKEEALAYVEPIIYKYETKDWK